MAKLITRGFRLVDIQDLSDLAKSKVSMEQMTGIAQDASQEVEERRYEDSMIANLRFRKAFSGNITLKGDIEAYVLPSYSTSAKTEPLFELDHYYLIRYISLDINDTSEMIYGRWVGQLVELPKVSKDAGEITVKEVVLGATVYQGGGSASYEAGTPYCATATDNAMPTGDYDPLYEGRCVDTTKTLAAAETIITTQDTITNPWAT